MVDIEPGTFFDDPINWLVDMEFTGVPTVWDGYDCDVLPDGILDIYDSMTYLVAHGSIPGDPNWNPRADINNDGVVNIIDRWFLHTGFGKGLTDVLGTIQFGPFSRLEGTSGNGILATVIFMVIGFGETALDLDDTKLSSLSATPIPHEVKDGTVSVPMPPPVEAIQSLTTTVESLNLKEGTENSLTTTLKAADHLLSIDKPDQATHKLNDFICHVNALRDKKLTDDQADYLVASAQAIINAIG